MPGRVSPTTDLSRWRESNIMPHDIISDALIYIEQADDTSVILYDFAAKTRQKNLC